jgi:hypothetical protein
MGASLRLRARTVCCLSLVQHTTARSSGGGEIFDIAAVPLPGNDVLAALNAGSRRCMPPAAGHRSRRNDCCALLLQAFYPIRSERRALSASRSAATRASTPPTSWPTCRGTAPAGQERAGILRSARRSFVRTEAAGPCSSHASARREPHAPSRWGAHRDSSRNARRCHAIQVASRLKRSDKSLTPDSRGVARQGARGGAAETKRHGPIEVWIIDDTSFPKHGSRP